MTHTNGIEKDKNPEEVFPKLDRKCENKYEWIFYTKLNIFKLIL